MRALRSIVFAAELLALAAGAYGQGLVEVKRMWRSGQYEAVLRPLLDLRDTQPSFEVDYMLGTALCRVPAFASDGYDFLNTLLYTYRPPFRFDGRPADIRQAERDFCPPPGVSQGISPIGGAGTQSIEMRRRVTPDAIARNVRNKLNSSAQPPSTDPGQPPNLNSGPHPPVLNSGSQPGLNGATLPPEMTGNYSMVHDGWRGRLLLTTFGGTYTDSEGRTFPIKFGSLSGNHLIFYIVGLGEQNADGTGGQKFDAYFMTQTRDAFAGTTQWQGTRFGFYAIKR